MDSNTPLNSNTQSDTGLLSESTLSPATISNLYRLALLLTGSPDVAEQILLQVYEQFALQLGQFRTERHRTAFLTTKIREEVTRRIPDVAEEAKEGIAARFSNLTEPSKSSLALFYLDFLPIGELAALVNVDLVDLAARLAQGREQLGANLGPIEGDSTKLKKTAQFLPCYQPDKAADSRVAKAVKAAENDPVLKSRLEAQIAFDSERLKQIHALEMPPSLLEKIAAAEKQKPKRVGLNVFKQPAFLSVGFAILVVIGVLLYFTLNHMNRFEGEENVTDLLETTEAMSGIELEPKATQLGLLGDWLFSRYGFEDYKIPSEFSSFKTVGCRVFKQNGKRVAQIAVEPDNLIFFLFQPKDFGVKLSSKAGWRTFEQDGWAGAVRVYEGTCVMIAMLGDKDDIEAVLKKSAPKPKS